MHQIKNALADERRRRDAKGYIPDEMEKQINELTAEVCEQGLAGSFLSFTRFMGLHEGFKVGLWTGVFIGIILTFLTLTIAKLFF